MDAVDFRAVLFIFRVSRGQAIAKRFLDILPHLASPDPLKGIIFYVPIIVVEISTR